MNFFTMHTCIVGVIKSGMDYNLSVKGFAYSPTYLEVGLLLT